MILYLTSLNRNTRKIYLPFTGPAIVFPLVHIVPCNGWFDVASFERPTSTLDFTILFGALSFSLLTITDNGLGLTGPWAQETDPGYRKKLKDHTNRLLRVASLKNPGSGGQTGGLYGNGKLVNDMLCRKNHEKSRKIISHFTQSLESFQTVLFCLLRPRHE